MSNTANVTKKAREREREKKMVKIFYYAVPAAYNIVVLRRRISSSLKDFTRSFLNKRKEKKPLGYNTVRKNEKISSVGQLTMKVTWHLPVLQAQIIQKKNAFSQLTAFIMQVFYIS